MCKTVDSVISRFNVTEQSVVTIITSIQAAFYSLFVVKRYVAFTVSVIWTHTKSIKFNSEFFLSVLSGTRCKERKLIKINVRKYKFKMF